MCCLSHIGTQGLARGYVTASVAFGVTLVGGAIVLAGITVGSLPDISSIKPAQGLSIAKFSMAVVGGVIAGVGIGLAFVKAFGENDSNESWLKTWKPSRGAAAGLGQVAAILGAALSSREKTRRKAEIAALMWAWSEIVSPPSSAEYYELRARAISIMTGDLSVDQEPFSQWAQEALKKSLTPGAQVPDRIDRLTALTYHAVRLFWKYNPDWANVGQQLPPIEQSVTELKALGLSALPSVQALVTDRLKLIGVAVDDPEEAIRTEERKGYVQGGAP